MLQKRSRVWTVLGIFSFLILLFIHMFYDFHTLYISFTRYSLWDAVSLFSVPFAGFENYEIFFSSNSGLLALRNSLMFGVLTALVTTAITVPLVLGLNRLKNVFLRYGIAGLLFFPFLMTEPMLISFFVSFLSNPQNYNIVLSVFIIVVYKSIILVPFLVLLSLIVGQVFPIKEGRFILFSIVSAIGIGWFFGVNGSIFPGFLLDGVRGRELTDTLAMFASREALMTMSSRPLATVANLISDILSGIVLLPAGIAAAFLLPFSSQAEKPKEKNPVLSILAIPGILFFLILFIIGLIGGSMPPAELDRHLSSGNIIQTILVVITPIFGVILGIGLAGLIGQGKMSARIFLILSLLLLLPSGTTAATDYYFQVFFKSTSGNFPIFEVSLCALIPALFIGLYLQGKKKNPLRIFFMSLSSYFFLVVLFFFLPQKSFLLHNTMFQSFSAYHATDIRTQLNLGLSLPNDLPFLTDKIFAFLIPTFFLILAIFLLILAMRDSKKDLPKTL